MHHAERLEGVVSIDLVRASYRASAFPQDWSEEKRRHAELQYRKLLILAAENPGQTIAPTRDIDEMWHLHMLHPRAYSEDCVRLFGEIFDHDGGFGTAPGEEAVLRDSFLNTRALYEHRWGEPYSSDADGDTKCWHNCQSRCWHACRSK